MKSSVKVYGFMIWSIMKGVFMLQSSEIFVASGLLFPPSYILLAPYLFRSLVTWSVAILVAAGNLMGLPLLLVSLELNSRPGINNSGRGIPVAKGGAGNCVLLILIRV